MQEKEGVGLGVEKRVSVQEEIISILSRLRMLEDKHANAQRKLHMLEESLSEAIKDVRERTRMLEEELVEVKKELKDMREAFERLASTLKTVAFKDEVRMLEKYVNLLDPTQFVTRSQVERMIHAALRGEKNEEE